MSVCLALLEFWICDLDLFSLHFLGDSCFLTLMYSLERLRICWLNSNSRVPLRGPFFKAHPLLQEALDNLGIGIKGYCESTLGVFQGVLEPVLKHDDTTVSAVPSDHWLEWLAEPQAPFAPQGKIDLMLSS